MDGFKGGGRELWDFGEGCFGYGEESGMSRRAVGKSECQEPVGLAGLQSKKGRKRRVRIKDRYKILMSSHTVVM